MMFSTTARTLSVALAAVTLASSALIAAPGAQAAPASTTSPTAGAVKTSRMDIDGDGRRDTTTLRQTGMKGGARLYTLSTRTARGQVASTTFAVEDGGEDVSDVWVGAAGLDGVKGAEILVNPAPVGDGFPGEVYTWRNGKLVRERAAGAPKQLPYMWYVMNMPFGVDGYTFSTKRGVRYVVHHELVQYGSKPGRFTGTHTTYAWSNRRGWVKVSAKRAGVVSDKTAQAKYAGYFGVTFR